MRISELIGTKLLKGKLLGTNKFTHSFVIQDLVAHAQIMHKFTHSDT